MTLTLFLTRHPMTQKVYTGGRFWVMVPAEGTFPWRSPRAWPTHSHSNSHDSFIFSLHLHSWFWTRDFFLLSPKNYATQVVTSSEYLGKSDSPYFSEHLSEQLSENTTISNCWPLAQPTSMTNHPEPHKWDQSPNSDFSPCIWCRTVRILDVYLWVWEDVHFG